VVVVRCCRKARRGAQRCLQVGEAGRTDAQGARHLQEQHAFTGADRRLVEQKIQLDFEKGLQQLRLAATGLAQPGDVLLQGEIRALAQREAVHRPAHCRRLQAQVGHHGTRRIELLFGHTAIGLGQGAQTMEGGLEEQPLPVRRRPDPGIAGVVTGAAQPLILPGAPVELMAKRGTDDRSRRAADQQADDSAADFANPSHVLKSQARIPLLECCR
jgi:hypothetical protein